jgi:hypothetical protein
LSVLKTGVRGLRRIRMKSRASLGITVNRVVVLCRDTVNCILPIVLNCLQPAVAKGKNLPEPRVSWRKSAVHVVPFQNKTRKVKELALSKIWIRKKVRESAKPNPTGSHGPVGTLQGRIERIMFVATSCCHLTRDQVWMTTCAVRGYSRAKKQAVQNWTRSCQGNQSVWSHTYPMLCSMSPKTIRVR